VSIFNRTPSSISILSYSSFLVFDFLFGFIIFPTYNKDPIRDIKLWVLLFPFFFLCFVLFFWGKGLLLLDTAIRSWRQFQFNSFIYCVLQRTWDLPLFPQPYADTSEIAPCPISLQLDFCSRIHLGPSSLQNHPFVSVRSPLLLPSLSSIPLHMRPIFPFNRHTSPALFTPGWSRLWRIAWAFLSCLQGASLRVLHLDLLLPLILPTYVPRQIPFRPSRNVSTPPFSFAQFWQATSSFSPLCFYKSYQRGLRWSWLFFKWEVVFWLLLLISKRNCCANFPIFFARVLGVTEIQILHSFCLVFPFPALE